MSADFKPNLSGYTELRPFVFWAQTTMPTVFDDSLSYYEVLTKLTRMINVLLENTDTAEHNIEAIAHVFAQLQDYVNHYFDSLDVQEEVEAAIDKMVEDGTLQAIISGVVETVVDEQLDGTVANQLPAVVTEQLPDVVAPMVDELVPQYVEVEVARYVDEALEDAVADQISPVVEEQLPDVVATQLPDVVTETAGPIITEYLDDVVPDQVEEHIDDAVADQIDDAVADQLEPIAVPLINQSVPTLTSDWLAAHIDNPSNPPLDNTLSLTSAAAESWYVGRRLYDLRSAAYTVEEGVKVNTTSGAVEAAADWVTITAKVSYLFPLQVAYEIGSTITGTFAFYDASDVYVPGTADEWDGHINWPEYTPDNILIPPANPVTIPQVADTIKLSIDVTGTELVEDDLYIIVMTNAGDVIDAYKHPNIAVDPTLSISGAAADAKVTGQRFEEIQTEVDTVVGDVLTDYTVATGLYISTSGTLTTLSSGPQRTICIAALPDKTYVIKKNTSTVMRCGCGASDSLAADAKLTSFTTNGTASAIPLTVETTQTDHYIYIQLFVDGDSADLKTIEANTASLIVVENVLAEMTPQKAVPMLTANIQFHSGHYWDSQAGIGGTAVDGTASAYYGLDPIGVEAGQKLVFHLYGGASNKQYPILATDDNLVIIARYGNRSGWNNLSITVPEGATKILVTTQGSNNVCRSTVYKLVETTQEDAYTNTSFKGAKMSLLGDSFSAIQGVSSHKYYPNAGSNVQFAQQLWWHIVCDELGMVPHVISAWSGSCVTSGIRNDTEYQPASDPARCMNLDNTSGDPDVILIAMGVNDYSYTSNANQFGDWDGTTPLGSEADLSDYAVTDFKRAYATMIERIQLQYKYATIIAITPFFQMRKTTDTGANYLNAIGKSITDYANAVKEICGIMHIPVIDATNIGFTRFNYYPMYAEDSATIPTHPTVAGQAVIGKAVAEQMKKLHRFD